MVNTLMMMPEMSATNQNPIMLVLNILVTIERCVEIRMLTTTMAYAYTGDEHAHWSDADIMTACRLHVENNAYYI